MYLFQRFTSCSIPQRAQKQCTVINKRTCKNTQTKTLTSDEQRLSRFIRNPPHDPCPTHARDAPIICNKVTSSTMNKAPHNTRILTRIKLNIYVSFENTPPHSIRTIIYTEPRVFHTNSLRIVKQISHVSRTYPSGMINSNLRENAPPPPPSPFRFSADHKT